MYATVEDVRLRAPDLPVGSDATIEALLEDAAQLILDTHGDREVTASDATLKRISCAIVIRSMSSIVAGQPLGVESFQQGAGGYQESVKLSNPSGDMYLTRAERKALGLGGVQAFTVAMEPDPRLGRWWYR